jgi:hypothetical protein
VQIAYLNNFRLQMIAALQPILSKPGNGVFLLECFVHVVEDDSGAWNGIVVQGQTQVQTFTNWLRGGSGSTQASYCVSHLLRSISHHHILFQAIDGVWDSNPTCNKYANKPLAGYKAHF